MKYSIKDYDETIMPVYFNVSNGDPKENVHALVFSSELSIKEPIAEVYMTGTFHGYIINIHKMECDVKTAQKIISFFSDDKNWMPL